MKTNSLTRRLARRLLPASVRAILRRRADGHRPVRWGSLRRLEPVGRAFGLGRGQPIDRYYIEAFLSEHADAIRGRVLEVGDDSYTCKFGGGRVAIADVLHVTADNPQATIVADLTTGAGIPDETFDCLVVTQTLQSIYDVTAAVRTCRRILKPGGAILATFSGICQVSRYDMDRWGDYWRVTDASARRLFGDVFGRERVDVVTYGNVLSACALLQGLASHELTAAELDCHDPDYPVVVGVRAVKEESL